MCEHCAANGQPSTFIVDRVGESVHVTKDGALWITMSRQTAIDLGKAMFIIGQFGRDSLDVELKELLTPPATDGEGS